jgi:hypothetical protein
MLPCVSITPFGLPVVDESREILRLGLTREALELGGVGAVALGEELVEAENSRRLAADQDDRLHRGHGLLNRQEALEALSALHEDHLGARVVDDEGGLIGKQCGVDRHVYRERSQDREVQRRPVRAVLGHLRHAVSGLDPEAS